MARVVSNLPLLFTGKVGNISGSVRNGKQYIKALPGKRKGDPTLSQITVREKFKLAGKLAVSAKHVIKRTYTNHNKKTTGAVDVAKSHIYKDVIAGVYPIIAIDWQNLLLSKGKLLGLEGVNVMPVPGNIIYTWPVCYGDNGNMLDRIILIMYIPSVWRCVSYTPGAKRKTGYAVFDTALFKKEKVHLYICVISEDEKNTSNSTYLGEFELI